MTISEADRARFQFIGKKAIALALAIGGIQGLGINERDKGEAVEWVQEQETAHAAAQQFDTQGFQTIGRWTIVAAVASVIAAVAAVISIFR